ncbi:MAG TPA: NAD(P)/FAD-dependent oxidoreductase [Gemmatimonadaceae bacterium]|nr:NAD(P)/FAD-dependent oxidoreductase [Gemmatimonadaceae bacterium]
MAEREHIDTVVIGGGQSGLSVGYHLARRGLSFVILEANERVGDAWRRRWDSLRLFTPARYDGLAGMPFPAPARAFPTKDEMADYLESYARKFDLPVRTRVHVDRLSREGDRFVIATGDRTIEARQVVVAMANYQKPRIPEFASELRPTIAQLHSAEYRNPGQFQAGGVLVVGAATSGADIALEAVRAGHRTLLSGTHPGYVPFRIESSLAHYVLEPLVLRFVFHRVLSLATPMGRKMRLKTHTKGGPLVRVKPRDLVDAGVLRVGRTVGVLDGLPALDDGQALEIANVVWCTGYRPGFSWIDIPIFGSDGEPLHDRGVVATAPGMYFVGLHFLYAPSSTMIHGADRDARHVADAIVARSRRAAA